MLFTATLRCGVLQNKCVTAQAKEWGLKEDTWFWGMCALYNPEQTLSNHHNET